MDCPAAYVQAGESAKDDQVDLNFGDADRIVRAVRGPSFKKNCPDLRNTRVIDVIQDLESFNLAVDVHDHWVSAAPRPGPGSS